MTTDRLERALADNAWLASAREVVARDPAALTSLFPVAGRHCGRGVLDRAPEWTADDGARTLLLMSAALPGPQLVPLVKELYRTGDAAERRAVLRALPLLDVGSDCVDLLHDALRTNDTRLVAAAVGPYASHLDDASWRQAVLKCVFMAIPLASVDGLARRADAELAVMLGGLARERRAASRTIPDDALALLDSLT